MLFQIGRRRYIVGAQIYDLEQWLAIYSVSILCDTEDGVLSPEGKNILLNGVLLCRCHLQILYDRLFLVIAEIAHSDV